MEFANILVATDLSDESGCAARWAQQFKEAAHAQQVIVAHVIELSVTSWLKSAFEVLDDPTAREGAEAQVRDWYKEQTGKLPDEIVLRAGGAVQQLSEVVEELPGETLLVVAMSGRGALAKFFLGSTSHALANQPPGPVVVVHPDHDRLSPDVPILAGTDLSSRGARAVDFAAEICRHSGIRLEIMHGDGAPTSPLVNLEPDAVELDTRKREAEIKIEESSNLHDIDYAISIVFEDPVDAIIDRTNALSADLLVVGHSGESPIVRSVMGSVSQRILNHLPCSMLVVPPNVGVSDEEE